VDVCKPCLEAVVRRQFLDAIREQLFEDRVGHAGHLVQELRQHVLIEPFLRDKHILPAISSNAF
jgi:hypothetical protein